MKPFGRLQLLLDYLQKTVPAKLLEVHLAKYRFQLDPDTQKLMVPPNFDQKLEVEVIEKLKLSISPILVLDSGLRSHRRWKNNNGSKKPNNYHAAMFSSDIN